MSGATHTQNLSGSFSSMASYGLVMAKQGLSFHQNEGESQATQAHLAEYIDQLELGYK